MTKEGMELEKVLKEKAIALRDKANALAREFYSLMGYVVPDDFLFYGPSPRRHPQESLCWRMAEVAFDMLLETDLEDVLGECEDDEAECSPP